jgi:hypothetical protein
MSILVRFTNTSPTTTEQYDQSVQRLQQVGDFPPDGMEYHVCFIADGNIRVSEIWESREQLNAFAERLMPVLAEMGVEPGEPEIFEIHNVIPGCTHISLSPFGTSRGTSARRAGGAMRPIARRHRAGQTRRPA